MTTNTDIWAKLTDKLRPMHCKGNFSLVHNEFKICAIEL